MNDKYLVLWDVDGTLLTHKNVGRGLFAGLLSEIAKTYPDPRFDNQTKIQEAINTGIRNLGNTGAYALMELYKKLGLSEQEILRQRLIEASFEELPAVTAKLIMDKESDTRPKDGVDRIVKAIRRDQKFVQGLQTSNVRMAAAAKLGYVGLFDHFQKDGEGYLIGGYSDDVIEGKRRLPYPTSRTEFITSAREKVRKYNGLEFPDRRVIVIGDSEADLIAAQQAGATGILVAQSKVTLEQLASNAHYSFIDYPHPDQFLHAIVESTKKGSSQQRGVFENIKRQ